MISPPQKQAGVSVPSREPWAALRRFSRPRPLVERCDLCSIELPTDHQHLVEPATRRIVCACQACALLFVASAMVRFRAVPRDALVLSDFRLSDVQWRALGIPIGLAFFFHSTPAGKVVIVYPSPGGPTESALDAGDWDAIVRDNPVLAQMQPDTQALLVNRVGGTREHYLAPIDQCYRLTGLIRTRWQGFTGGDDVWREINAFFGAMKDRSPLPREASRA